MNLPRWVLDYAHASAPRSTLEERFAPATDKRMLARRVRYRHDSAISGACVADDKEPLRPPRGPRA